MASETVYIAQKTLDAIEQMLYVDQGNKWRSFLKKCMMELEDAYRSDAGPFRSHMGASAQGNACARAIWYGFRWATRPKFSGRIQRLFNRGHMEEGRVVALLQAIGYEVWQFDEHGQQFKIHGSYGHYGGSGDGILGGVLDVPQGEKCVFENKTHGDKSFKELKKLGVKIAKYEHWVQTQQYMSKFKIGYTLYIAVNKNDDEIYAEIIVADPEAADLYITRADNIIWLRHAPDRVGNPPSPGNFACKWCDHRPVCFLGTAPDKNCRTCINSMPTNAGGGEWYCEHWKQPIPKEAQVNGCHYWTQHPDMG